MYPNLYNAPILIFVSFALFTQTIADNFIVNTNNGPVQGHLVENDEVLEFMGIPFAAPPVGNLRFSPPEPASSWSDTYVADFIHPGCPQECALPPGTCPYTTSEDCLYLNIWAPADFSSTESLPVFVWIHGGSFTQGVSNCGLYNGSQLIETQRIIVVTVNYRLGVLGFLASNTFAGNYGLLDQRLALSWIKTNIANFGGNPDAITLAGQSAGAMSVLCHLTSQGSRDLFQQGVMESNPLALPYHTRTLATKGAFYVAQSLGCQISDIDCFRNASVDEILTAQDAASHHFNLRTIFSNFLAFTPVVDQEIIGDGSDNSTGWNVMNEQPFNAFHDAEIAQKPMVAGSVSEDGRLFVYEVFPAPVSSLEYGAALFLLFGISEMAPLAKMYPPDLFNNTTDTRDVLSLIATDLLFYCPLRNASQGFLSKASSDIYLYLFNHVTSFDPWGPNFEYCAGHVCHASELPFVFDVFSVDNITYEITDDEMTLTNNVMRYWNNFINYADPNGDSESYTSLEWPIYSTSDDNLIILNEPLAQAMALRSDYCDFWDSYGYVY